MIKTAGVVLTALLVGVIHFWATHWWQVIVAVPVAAGLGVLLNRAYRRRVSLPRHRRTLTHRGRTFERGTAPGRSLSRQAPASGRRPRPVAQLSPRRRAAWFSCLRTASR